MVELADAIVSTGREHLEKVRSTMAPLLHIVTDSLLQWQGLELIRNTPSWGATVVYGDTDSLFVYVPGKSKEDGFRIGNEIADKITTLTPRPIRMKFEKVSAAPICYWGIEPDEDLLSGLPSLLSCRQETIRWIQVRESCRRGAGIRCEGNRNGSKRWDSRHPKN